MIKTWDVLLIDGDRLFCAALAALLNGGPFHLVGEGIGPVEARDAVRESLERGRRPDLVLASLPSPASGHGADPTLLRDIRRMLPAAKLVALCTDAGTQTVRAALQVGADGCLHKSMSCEGLIRSLNLVMLGEAVFPRGVADLLAANGTGQARSDNGDGTGGELSRREMEILRCLLAGQSNKAIARHLNITESTVKMHFKNVMRKIRAQNRTQAAVWAIQHGLVTLVG